MRGSNSIEGYEVSLDDAIAILENDDEALDADQRTVLEVTGYRNAMTYVQQLADDPHFNLDQSLLRGLHFMMLGHDLTKSPGSYRQSTIYVHDEERDLIVYEGPDWELVPDLMAGLVDHLEDLDNDPQGFSVFTIAAMAHLNLVMVHPFRDGNGRMARCLQTLILARNQILGPEFSSIEEWLGRNTQQYYDVLAKTGEGNWNPQNHAGEWVRFNLMAHHMQAQTVWRRVQISEQLWIELEKIVEKHGVPDRTISALFSASLGLRVRRTAYQEDVEIEGPSANRDLKTLVSAGLLKPRGETRGRYYLGSDGLRDMYQDIRKGQQARIENPYMRDKADAAPLPGM